MYKKEQKNPYAKDSKAAKGIRKSCVTKRPNPRIMSIKDGEEDQAKGVCKILKKSRKFPKSPKRDAH
jgi:hypothetical protein